MVDRVGSCQGNADVDAVRYKTMLNPLRTCAVANTRAWREREFPASNGHTNARALAAFYSLLAMDAVDGAGRVLSRATLRAATQPASKLFGGDYGLGFNLSSDGATVPGQPRGTFGHGGLGGHISFADPAARLGFAFCMNRHVGGALQPGHRLQRVAYECLAAADLAGLAAPGASL